MGFGLTRPEIESEFTASEADALSTRPLIGCSSFKKIDVHAVKLMSPKAFKSKMLIVLAHIFANWWMNYSTNN